MRVLLIEDDRRIATFLLRGLAEEGHVVALAEDLAAARAQLGTETWDLLLVDRMLPDGDGLSLIQTLRRAGNNTPSICLTARDRTEEKVAGLYGGADDYIVKPFDFEELLARMASVLRRSGRADRLEVADLVLDVPGRRAWRSDQLLRLTAKEFDLLRYLAEHRGRVVSRTRLLDAVWDTTHDPGTNVVDVYISYLRAKVDKGFTPALIHTVRGVGYVLDESER